MTRWIPSRICLVYYLALKKAGVPVEYHLYANGGHGFGLRRTTASIGWPELAETWLDDHSDFGEGTVFPPQVTPLAHR